MHHSFLLDQQGIHNKVYKDILSQTRLAVFLL